MSSKFHQNIPFAMIEKDGLVHHYTGVIHTLHTLEELKELTKQSTQRVIFMNPFRTLSERLGHEAIGDEPILALEVTSITDYTREQVATLISDHSHPTLTAFVPTMSDEIYQQKVTEIQEQEIKGGNICQMVFSRALIAELASDPLDGALATYRTLLSQRGAYMTFLFSDGKDNIFVSATPEEHLGVSPSEVRMNPIAGTVKKPQNKAELYNVLRKFLKTDKEINELMQVLDEGLKMMEEICKDGGRVEGPFLKQNGAVIHTEYRLIGKRKPGKHPMDLLRETLHAPTLVGGPLQSASHQITKYEQTSRGYYGGEIGIYNPQSDTLDTAISIRMAHFLGNSVRIQSGAGIVRDSTPVGELQEIESKARGIKDALIGSLHTSYDVSEDIQAHEMLSLLSARNAHLSSFHLSPQSIESVPELSGRKVILIDNKDAFSHMLARMIQCMGASVEIVTPSTFDTHANADIFLIGPGPGDINDPSDPDMQKLNEITQSLISSGKPLCGVCLGHQAIAKARGNKVSKLSTNTQGLQTEIDIFGKKERVGSYNSFAAFDQDGKQYDSYLGDHIASVQFHPESIMTQNGGEILKKLFLESMH